MSDETLPPPAESHDPRDSDLLPLEAARRIDAVCEQFEQALQTGRPMTIETFLSQSAADGIESATLLRELLSLELEYRLRRGEHPTSDEYLPRFHTHEKIVELAFHESAASQAAAIPSFLVDHPRYRVERLLGTGGMGSVYLAEHRVLERNVAVKVIKPELLSDPGMVARFRSEVKAAAKLSHPNVVTVYDAETAGEGHLLVMEYVPGTDLARMVADCGPLPVATACNYIAQAAQGLQHAHQHGMVHRDITPRNLMLTADGQVKVLDFGLAYFVSKTVALPGQQAVLNTPQVIAGAATNIAKTDGSFAASASQLLLGSIDYMAPEQAADPQSADIRADVYSLGCTLYYLLTGRPPFPSGTLLDKLERHAHEPPRPVSELRDDASAELAQVVGRMLEKSPADRFQTPAEVAAALAPFADTSGAARKRRNRRRWIAAAVAMSLCAFMLIAWSAGWPPFADSDGEKDGPRVDAEQLYRDALTTLGNRREASMREALRDLQKAIELAPSFAPAYAALADAYNLAGDYGWEKPDEVFPKAKEAAKKAIALDGKLAEAHLALAFALDTYDRDVVGAEREFKLAIQLNKKLAAAHHWYAWFLLQQGRLKEAVKQIDEAKKLGGPDQIIIANNAGKIAYLQRDYDLAKKNCQHAIKLSPDFRKAHRDLAQVYAETGKLDEALAELKLAKGVTDDNRDLHCVLAYANARNGHARQARDLLTQLVPLADQKPLAYDIAAIYAALGDEDSAFAWLQRAFREHSVGRAGLGIDPRFDGLHNDPRFQKLLPKKKEQKQ